ncbi:MAG: O-antigen ligase family protein [Syntrophomonadaceae bacterium]|jgi:O-antigen ligase
MERFSQAFSRYLLYIVPAYVLVDYFLRQGGSFLFASMWDEILFILIAGSWVLYIAVKGVKPISGGLLIPLLLFYSVIFFNYLVVNEEPAIALMELRAVVQYSFWFFLALNLIKSKEQVKNTCDLFLAVGAVVALYGIYQYIIGAEIPANWVDQAEVGIRTRAFSFIGSPNVLGSFTILNISIAFASFMASKHWFKKRIYLGAAGISALCLVFTLSRGAWLVFFFAFLLLALWLDKRILIILLLAVLITPVAVPSVYNRMAYMLSPQYVASSSEGGRIASWNQALEYWQGKPVTGLGLGRFGGGVAIANFPGSAYSVDNYYLKMGTQTGLMGLTAFLYLIFMVVRKGKRAVAQATDPYLKILGNGILVALIAILGHNMVENLFEFPLISTYFWFFLGMLLAIPLITKPDLGVEQDG